MHSSEKIICKNESILNVSRTCTLVTEIQSSLNKEEINMAVTSNNVIENKKSPLFKNI